MLKFTRYPVASSLILGLATVAILASVSGLYTLWMTTVLSGDAKAVNLSGSLRMQSYRIAYLLEQEAPVEQIEHLLDEFSQRLTSVELKGQIPSEHPTLSEAFATVESGFDQMHFAARTAPAKYLVEVDGFVEDIDRLVAQLERWSEDKVDRLRRQQIVITLVSLFAAALFATIVNRRVVVPLQRLSATVYRIGQGDRTSRVAYSGKDEFGNLASTLNQMADEVDDVHGNLESTIQEQTAELSRNNRILEFLFSLSQRLSTEKPDIHALKLQTLQDLRDICPEQSVDWRRQGAFNATKAFAIRCDADRSFLVCESDSALAAWQQQLLRTVCDLFDSAISRIGAYDQENRIALLNERSTIARELHDSLAQQLSYLKIQVVRLVKLRQRNADDATLNTIIEELRDGLNASYRKLRELLVTFRSQLNEPGLVPSVQAAADDINRVSPDCQIHLIIDEHWPATLTPSQEIHCLHVIREALTNVIKHARAENAVVSMSRVNDNQLSITIHDDGIGFSETLGKPMHYGLDIMTERAARIGGTITYQNLNRGGVGVRLTFPLNSAEEDSL